jgi:hypothetical protein
MEDPYIFFQKIIYPLSSQLLLLLNKYVVFCYIISVVSNSYFIFTRLFYFSHAFSEIQIDFLFSPKYVAMMPTNIRTSNNIEHFCIRIFDFSNILFASNIPQHQFFYPTASLKSKWIRQNIENPRSVFGLFSIFTTFHKINDF